MIHCTDNCQKKLTTDGLTHWLTVTLTDWHINKPDCTSGCSCICYYSRPSSFLLLWQQHFMHPLVTVHELPFELENWMFNAWITGPTLTIYPTIVPQAPVETNITLQEDCKICCNTRSEFICRPPTRAFRTVGHSWDAIKFTR